MEQRPWPPALSPAQLSHLTTLARTFALSRSLLYLPPISNPNGDGRPSTASAIHAPFSLFPAPVPRTLFDSAQKIQSTYNVLYARIASDVGFLDEVMGLGGGVADVDEFTRELWSAWKSVRDDSVQVIPFLSLYSHS